MKMKKYLIILVALIGFGFSVNAQSRNVSSTTIFDNEKLNITRFVEEEDLYGNGSFWRIHTYMSLTNKTNDEIEVRVNYKITVYRIANNAIVQEQTFNNKLLKLSPNQYFVNDALRNSMTVCYPDCREIVSHIELINYRVIKKNYEIP